MSGRDLPWIGLEVLEQRRLLSATGLNCDLEDSVSASELGSAGQVIEVANADQNSQETSEKAADIIEASPGLSSQQQPGDPDDNVGDDPQELLGAIHGIKWLDKNGNGERDPDEQGVPGVTVYDDANGNGVLDDGERFTVTMEDDADTNRDESGRYWLEELRHGVHIIREDLPDGFEQTFPVRVLSEDDSPADGADTLFHRPPPHIVILSAGGVVDGIDFGNRPVEPGSIHGIKWLDRNGDGERDLDEPAVAGVTVYDDVNRNGLLDDDEPFAVTMEDDSATDHDETGRYWLESLRPGIHFIREVLPDGSEQTYPVWPDPLPIEDIAGDTDPFFHRPAPHIVVIASGEVVNGIDFGNRPVEPGSVHGIKWLDKNGNGEREADEPGVAGVTIYSDLNRNGVHDDYEPFDVTMEDNPVTDFDETGLYWLEGLRAGLHIIREVLPDGFEQTFPTWPVALPADGVPKNGITDLQIVHRPAPHVVWLEAGDEVDGIDFGNRPIEPGSIHGLKWFDRNGNGERDATEPGVAGVTIYDDVNRNGRHDAHEPFAVTMEDDPVTDFDETGLYWLEGLRPGLHIIREVLPDGFEQTFPTWPVLLTDDRISDVEILHRPAPHVVWLESGEEVDGIDFGNRPIEPGSIHGLKWLDRNGNGEREATEPGLAGVTVYSDVNRNGRHDDHEPFAVTMEDDPVTDFDETGLYWLEDLRPGLHIIREVLPDGYEQTYPTWPVVLPVDLTTGLQIVHRPVPHVVWLEPGEVVDGIDFGNRPASGSIHGLKWLDRNGNGQRDQHEPGVPNVIIYSDRNNNGELDPDEPRTTTMSDNPHTAVDESGHYWLRGLTPGAHHIAEILPLGWEQTFPGPAARLGDVTATRIAESDATNFDVIDAAAHPAGVPELVDVEAIFEVLWKTVCSGLIEQLTTHTVTGDEIHVDLFGRTHAVTCIEIAPEPEQHTVPIEDLLPNTYGLSATLHEAQLHVRPIDETITNVDNFPVVDLRDGVDIRPRFEATWELSAKLHVEGAGSHHVLLEPGEKVEGIDFGNRPVAPGSIHGIKWLDSNGNGERENDEPGLPGVTIYVDLNNNRVLDDREPSAVSMADDPNTDFDEAGLYWIEGVPPGDRIIREVVPSHLLQTYPARGLNVAHPGGQSNDPEGEVRPSLIEADLAAGDELKAEVSLTISPVCIREFELDVQSSDPNVELVNHSGIQTNSCGGDTTTFEVSIESDGRPHRFDLLFVDAEFGGTVGSIPVVLNTLVDGDGAHIVWLDPGESIDGIDFGNHPARGSIHGLKWLDLNANGERDMHEPGVPHVLIFSDSNNNGVLDRGEPRTLTMRDNPLTTVDEAGRYWLRGLKPGVHHIAEVLPQGWEQTFPGPAASLGHATATRIAESAAFDFDAIGADAHPAGVPELADVDVTFEVSWGTVCSGLIGQLTSHSVTGNQIDVDLFGRTHSHSCILIVPEPELHTVGIEDLAPDVYELKATLHEALLHVTPIDEALGNVDNLPVVDLHDDTDVRSLFEATWLMSATLKVSGAGSHRVHLGAGEVVEGIDFGNRPVELGSIHGVKWLDRNGNGEREQDEPGVPGITVFDDANRNGVLDQGERFTVTMEDDPHTDRDEAGLYWLEHLRPGIHYIREILPHGFAQTFPVWGPVPQANGAPNAAPLLQPVPAPHIVRLGPGEVIEGIDFGNRPFRPGAIHGIKWLDENNNAERDPDEPGVPGVTVFDDANGNGVLDPGERFTVTMEDDLATSHDETGHYWLEDLRPGIHYIYEVLPDGFVQTFPLWRLPLPANSDTSVVPLPLPRLAPHVVRLEEGDVVDGIDFGNRPFRPGSIHGVKWLDRNSNAERDPDEPGVAGVTVFDDANGNGLLDPGERSTVTMEDDPDTTRDETGHYWLEELRPGIHTIYEVLPAGFVQTFPLWQPLPRPAGIDATDAPLQLPRPAPHVVRLEEGDVIEGIDFGNRPFRPAAIHGVKWLDENANAERDPDEPGVPGVTIFDDANRNGVLDPDERSTVTMEDDPTTIRDESGHYWLDDLRPGVHYIYEVLPDGFEQTFPRWSLDQLPGEDGLTIAPWWRSVPHVVVLGPGEVVEGIDFGNRPVDPGSIHGIKWLDENGNGERDPDEPGVPDVTVFDDANRNGVLDEGERFAVTMEDNPDTDFDEGGLFWLHDLRPGIHYIREVLSDGSVQTFPRTGVNVIHPSGQSNHPQGEVRPSLIEASLVAGEVLTTEVSLTISPVCIRAVDVDVQSSDPDVEVANHSGIQTNGCGGDKTTFEVSIVGDGRPHRFDLLFVDAEFGGVVGSIPVVLSVVVDGDGAHVVHLEPGDVIEGIDFGNRPVEVPASWMFDFGTSDSPVALGYTQVTESTILTATRRFGWLGNDIVSADRGLPDALRRDLNATQAGTFAANLINGFYHVTVTVGDQDLPSHVTVTVEDMVLGTVQTAAGVFATLSADIPVVDGQFTILIESLSNSNLLAPINALEITPAESPASIHGIKWNDRNGNGVQDIDEPGLAGQIIYLDMNENGELDDGEPTTTTMEDDPATLVNEVGMYWFDVAAPHRYVVAEVIRPHWQQTLPGPSAHIVESTTSGESPHAVDFDLTGASAGLVPSGGTVDVTVTTIWSDSCGTLIPDLTTHSVSDDQITIDMFGAHIGEFCADVLVPESQTIHVGQLAPGTYFISATLHEPSGGAFVPTLSVEGTMTVDASGTYTIDVAPGENVQNINFGNRELVSSTLPFEEDFDDSVADDLHAISGTWAVEAGRYEVTPSSGLDALSRIELAGPVPSDLQFSATMRGDASGNGYKSNTFMIFDYIGPTDFKFAGARIHGNKWIIGHRDDTGWHKDTVLEERIDANTDYRLQLVLEGSQAALMVDGHELSRFDFQEVLTDGDLGLGTDSAHGQFDNVAVRAKDGMLPLRENFEDTESNSFQVQNGHWSVKQSVWNHVYEAAPTGRTDAVSTIQSDALPDNLAFSATLHSQQTGGGYKSNGMLIFNYKSPTEFNFAGSRTLGNKWVIGHRDANGWHHDRVVTDVIDGETDYQLQLQLSGSRARLFVDGVEKTSVDYDEPLTDGELGLGTDGAVSQFDHVVIEALPQQTDVSDVPSSIHPIDSHRLPIGRRKVTLIWLSAADGAPAAD